MIKGGFIMKKIMFKKILCLINYSNQIMDMANLKIFINEQLSEEKLSLNELELSKIIHYMEELGLMYKDTAGYDLIPCACVFAKAEHHSISESLAFIECLIKKSETRLNVDLFLKNNIDEQIFDDETWKLLLQLNLLENDDKHYRLNPILKSDILNIRKEYKHDSPIISFTLSAIYANSLISDKNMEYRNEEMDIVSYSYLNDIFKIMPRKGIPENRDVTKPIQIFYKDTLMHEFHHACPICNIDIPHMLIASHIKPFRVCAHVFEALDHHNGLLLCRNHDYLFDQGYITFDDQGSIMISPSLKTSLYSAFCIHESMHLSKEYVNENRSLFLDYHRNHIFMK